jgi:NADH-quinone oxidoreductase subunit N
VKRILAYSSIAHLGYILVAFLASGERGAEAVSFYLIAYFITIIGAFAIVSLISEGEVEAFNLEEYKGLFWQRPWMASIFTTLLLSLAGIPLTAGFIGKFYVLSAGVNKGLWLLSIVLVVGSVIGLYYYLKIIVEMFKQPAGSPAKSPFSLSTSIALIILAVLVIWLGVNPGGVAEIIRSAAMGSFVIY